MNVTRTVSPAITLLSALAMGAGLLAGCDPTSSDTSSAGGGFGNPAVSDQPAGASGRCSDPNPDPISLTFAAVVCIVSTRSVAQPDGSTELKIRVAVTDKDPNVFAVTATDFSVQDSVGHSIDAEGGAARTGAADCLVQSSTDSGWPVQPGQTFAVPEPFCFHLSSGQQPESVIWQDDVTVGLG